MTIGRFYPQRSPGFVPSPPECPGPSGRWVAAAGAAASGRRSGRRSAGAAGFVLKRARSVPRGWSLRGKPGAERGRLTPSPVRAMTAALHVADSYLLQTAFAPPKATHFMLIKTHHLIPALGLLCRRNRREERISKVALSPCGFSSGHLVLLNAYFITSGWRPEVSPVLWHEYH